MDWPKHKLDVQLLLEDDDQETIATARQMHLPDYFRIVIVPNSLPKTKPKACNYGLAQAKGEYLVIYDAEDIPDPLQLKKAYLTFTRSPHNIRCLQAKLNYFNPHQNLLTRLFSIEYSLWFDVILPGLQTVETMIPLGGTSNHFRTRDLQQLHGWDPFNVTEDCDLGIRLFKKGWRTAIIDSVTLEEANSSLTNWLRQRSRWIKGYMQTFLVHMRNPGQFFREHGRHALFFQLVVGGKILFMLINPVMWILTISYFGLYAQVGEAIESIFPGVIFGMALTSLVFGNFLFVFCYMIGVARRSSWSLMKYVYMQPLYWLAVSTAAGIALYQLIVKPHYWEKTHHGLHLSDRKHERPVPATRIKFATEWVYAAGMILGYGLNFLYNWILSRTMTLADFGTITLIGSILYLGQALFLAVSRTVSYHSAYLYGKYQAIIKTFWRTTNRKTVWLGVILTGLFAAGIPLTTVFFRTEFWPLITFTPVILIGLLYAVDTGFLTGQQRYRTIGLIVTMEAIIKLGLASAGSYYAQINWIFLALPVSMFLAFIITRIRVLQLPEKVIKIPAKLSDRFPKHFFGSVILSRLSIVTFLSIDLLAAKHYLTPDNAGVYALLSLLGKGIFFAGSIFGSLITSTAGLEAGAQNPKSKVGLYIIAAIISSVAAGILVGPLGYLTLPLVFGERGMTLVGISTIYAIGITAFTIASIIVTLYQAKAIHIFSAVSFGLTLAQIAAHSRWHGSVQEIALVIAASGLVQLTAMLGLAALVPLFGRLRNFGLDLMDLFGSYRSASPPPDKLRFLIFNWRDTKHVWAGGAEVYIREIAKEWIREGHKVTIFCGNDGHNARNEVVNGIQIIRRGGNYTVYLWAFIYYLSRLRGHFDVVIDCENGIPFFTPFYVRVPKFLLIFHVHQRIFREHLRTPFKQIAQFLEARLMPFTYKREKVVTISASTHDEIISLGIAKRRYVQVIEPGVRIRVEDKLSETPYPSFLYIGRLKPYKNIDIAIRAFAEIYRKFPTSVLTIAGSGESRWDLMRLAKELGLTQSVKFTGQVTNEQKHELYLSSWAAIQPSSYEGWGLTVIEANACGTPVIAANVPGLRDSVVPNRTGILFKKGDVEALTRAMRLIVEDKGKRRDLARHARVWAERFRWDLSAKKFTDTIYATLHKEYSEANYPT